MQSISNASETIFFVKVVSTLCIHRASLSNFTIFSSNYFLNHLNPHIVHRVIQHLCYVFHNPLSAFNFFAFTRDNLSIAHSICSYKLLMGSLCRAKLHDSAKDLFHYLKADGHLSDGSTLELLLRSLQNAGRFEFAKEVLVAEAEFCNVKDDVVSSHVLNGFLECLVRGDRVDEALGFLNDHAFRLISFSVSSSSFNIVIRGLCNEGEVDKAVEVFRSMKGRGCLPDVVIYHTLITGFCKIGDVDKAKGLMKEMESRLGVPPNVVTYTLLVSACCKLGKLDEGVKFVDEMVGNGIKPDLFTYSVLIDGFGKAGNMGTVSKLHQMMLQSGCQPDVVTYTSLIHGYCRVGELDTGLKLFDEMGEKMISPNLCTFSVLINALCKVNRLNEARCLLSKLQMRDDITPRSFIYNPVIDGFCKAGNVDEANIILGEMEAKRCPPDRLTFTILILGHYMKGRMSEAISIFNKMLQVGCAPDKICVNCMVSCLTKAGMVREADKIRHISFDSMQGCLSSKRIA